MQKLILPAFVLPAFVTCVCLLSLMICGCRGKVRHEVKPVSGKITLKGKPMAGVGVRFQPIAKAENKGDAGLGSNGITDNNGRYELKTLDGQLGAVVGEHSICIFSMKTAGDPDPASQSPEIDQIGGQAMRNPFPPHSSDGSMRFEVPAGGTDKADFDF